MLLAAIDPAEVDTRYADALSTDALAALHESLTAVRAAGYGLNRGGTEQGIAAVGVAVRDDEGRAVAAVSVSVPSMRLTRQRVPELVAALRRCNDRTGRLTQVG